MEKATFGAGCFWGVEAAFLNIDGVIKTSVGYSGGRTKNPTDEAVCTDTTGHAEVVQIEFASDIVSYDNLLNIFWEIHDPTTLNSQGPDFGSQYRSVIFFHSTQQEALAYESKAKMQNSGRFRGQIVTEISPAKEFYIAEVYHQQYYQKRGIQGCRIY
ncbi:MAG: peptide-methionine (S)-S-oxide reductase MsrA [Cyanobacteriota bacterium]